MVRTTAPEKTDTWPYREEVKRNRVAGFDVDLAMHIQDDPATLPRCFGRSDFKELSVTWRDKQDTCEIKRKADDRNCSHAMHRTEESPKVKGSIKHGCISLVLGERGGSLQGSICRVGLGFVIAD